MPSSIERITEDRFISLFSGVTGISIYNSERADDKNYYSTSGVLVVAAESLGKELTPGSGVFEVAISLDFGVKIHDTTTTASASKWEEIRQQLYYDTPIHDRVTTAGFTCYGVTNEGESVEIDDEIKLWKKTMNIKAWVTPR